MIGILLNVAFWRRLASAMMLFAALSLAPMAMAGAMEATGDAVRVATAAGVADADGCVSPTPADQPPDTTGSDAAHCPGCCLHQHGTSGMATASSTLAAPSKQALHYVGWRPTPLAEAPSNVLKQPPRA